MTERDYECLLDAVQQAVELTDGEPMWMEPAEIPSAANDNGAEWLLVPFPEGWHASP